MVPTHIPSAPPAATGNDGAHFEARVGAHYLLTMLANGSPRGLAGAKITTVAFQQRIAGHPLDDIVVHAVDAAGAPATLEIQVKRSMTFTGSDREFADVVGQMWQAFQKPEFRSQRYQLATAIARSTTRIDHDVQEVLRWAREHAQSASFFANLARKGAANDRMRDFVTVFRAKLAEAGGSDDDDTVWLLLNRFCIMTFDFGVPASDYEARAVERATGLLAPDDRIHAGDLWNALIVDAEKAASAGGARTPVDLRRELLSVGGFRLEPAPDLREFMANLSDAADLAMADIDVDVQGVHLPRVALGAQVLAEVHDQRVVNISGAPGVGKSAVLKRVFLEYQGVGVPIAINSSRIVAGGWSGMAHQLGTTLPSAVVFNEIASAGGALVLIDNIDQMEDPREQATVRDLLAAVGRLSGWRAVVTTGGDNPDWRRLLPPALQSAVVTIEVPELSDDEADDLSSQNESLAAILAPDHPAAHVARNLFFLRRIAELGQGSGTVTTELDLAGLWWSYGGGRAADAGRFRRLQVLRRMAEHFWRDAGQASVRTDDLETAVVPELIRLDALREVTPGADVVFRHDVMRDWAIGYLVKEQPERLVEADKSQPLPAILARGLEITARLALARDPTGQAWRELLGNTGGDGVHGSWRRPLILAIVRSEVAAELLETLRDLLFADDAVLLRELLRLVMVMDAIPVREWMKRLPPTAVPAAFRSDFSVPAGRSWIPLMVWLAGKGDAVPHAAVPDVVMTFFSWLLVGQRLSLALSSRIVDQLFRWLSLVDRALEPRTYFADDVPPDVPAIPRLEDTREQLRLAAFNFAHLNPVAATTYLEGIGGDLRYRDFQAIMKARGSLPKAAAPAFAAFMLAELRPDEEDDGHRRYGPFSLHEDLFLNVSPSRGPFLDILRADAVAGLALVREIVGITTAWMLDGVDPADVQRLPLPLPGGTRTFVGGGRMYELPRSSVPSCMTTCALMALEAWAHEQLDAGNDPETVLDQVLGPDGGTIAFVAVAIDVVLSHWELMRDLAWPLFTSPRLLQLDGRRLLHDRVGVYRHLQPDAEPNSSRVTREQLEGMISRRVDLQNVLGYYPLYAPDEVAGRFAEAARAAALAVEAVEPAGDEDPIRGVHAVARRTVRMLDRGNWTKVMVPQSDGSTLEMEQFVPDAQEQQRIADEQERAQVDAVHSNTVAWLHLAFRGQAEVTPENIRLMVAWAKTERATPHDDAAEDVARQMAHRATVMAAALVALHYREADRDQMLAWARPVLEEEAARPAKKDAFENDQIEYHAAAIATAGLVALSGPDVAVGERADRLLSLAANSSAASANALADGLKSWPDDDPLSRALVRVLVVRASYIARAYDEGDDALAGRQAGYDEMVQQAVDAEQAWLAGESAEPAWPRLPDWPTRSRRKRRITRNSLEEVPQKPKPAPALYVNERRLAALLRRVFPLMIGRVPDWIVGFMQHLMEWTIAANTGDEDDQPEGRPTTWNAEFQQDAGFLCAAISQNAAIGTFISPFLELGDDAFHDFAAGMMRGFDIAVFSIDALKPADVTFLRRMVAERLRRTWNYQRMGRDKGMTSEVGAADALRALFFSRSNFFGGGGVTFPADWQQLQQVIPLLAQLAIDAPASGFIASLFLDVLEAAPRPAFLNDAARTFVALAAAYGGDQGFWVHRDMGARMCNWLADRLAEGPQELDPTQYAPLTGAIDVVLRAGVASARRVEEALAFIGRPAA